MDHLERHVDGELLRVEAWGPHAVRVRASADVLADGLPGALDAPPPSTVDVEVSGGRLVNGRLTVELDARGRLRFGRTGGGELLAEATPHTWYSGPRVHAPRGDGTYRLEQHFAAYPGEKLYGLGQQLHGRLDQAGCVVDLVQGNTVATIPFLYSSRGYGLLWNNPAMGRVELAADSRRWVADAARQIDYWIVAGDAPAQVMALYADATGHPPLLPEWASGFWQSKLRYRSQEELLAVAREYTARGLPLSVIVCDFFHWTRMGDWSFDADDWPDPAAMLAELHALGVQLAVSVWPTVEDGADTFSALRAAGALVRDAHGGLLRFPWPARGHAEHQPMAYYDASAPQGREYLWRKLSDNYPDVAAFWLDACEPDLSPEMARRAVYAAGGGEQVGNLYGRFHAQAVADGWARAGNDRPLSLIRSAWAGSQRYGAALWSGDIPATWDSLNRQVRAGLNVAMSGIPWWNTDIGGFSGGDASDPAYQELVVRWFQYGTFSPIMRLHGDRAPNWPRFAADMTGGPNEVWSYGEAYPILRAHLLLRERLRPYLHELAETAHASGAPVIRPLFFDFPGDPRAWEIDDAYLFGPDVLVAPVTAPGVRERTVYLPAGATWTDVATGTTHDGGATIDAAAPIEHLPIFVRTGAAVAAAFQ